MLWALICPAKAEWEETELAEKLGVDELEDAGRAEGLSKYGTLLSDFSPGDALQDLAGEALQAAITPAALQRTAACVLVVLLCGLIRSTFGVSGTKGELLTLAGAASISALTLSGGDALIALSVETLGKAQDTANVLLPVLSGAALVSGQITAASAKYAAASLFLNVLTNLCVNGVIPVVKLYAAAAAVEAAGGGETLSGVLGFLKWCVTTALSVLLLAFTIYLSLSGLVSGSADAAVLRGAKTAISTMLPIVGSIASDAAASLLAAAGVVRQAVGVFGLVLLASVLLLPFLRVGVQVLLFKGAAAISAGLADGALRKLLGRMGETMTMLLACLGACGLMLYFSVFALMGVSMG